MSGRDQVPFLLFKCAYHPCEDILLVKLIVFYPSRDIHLRRYSSSLRLAEICARSKIRRSRRGFRAGLRGGTVPVPSVGPLVAVPLAAVSGIEPGAVPSRVSPSSRTSGGRILDHAGENKSCTELSVDLWVSRCRCVLDPVPRMLLKTAQPPVTLL